MATLASHLPPAVSHSIPPDEIIVFRATVAPLQLASCPVLPYHLQLYALLDSKGRQWLVLVASEAI